MHSGPVPCKRLATESIAKGPDVVVHISALLLCLPNDALYPRPAAIETIDPTGRATARAGGWKRSFGNT